LSSGAFTGHDFFRHPFASRARIEGKLEFWSGL
jgi:hypothetical protein